MHIDDLRKFALLWLHKTEEVRADKDHYATNITGDIYESGWISEMYGYSFGAAEVLHFSQIVLLIRFLSCYSAVLGNVICIDSFGLKRALLTLLMQLKLKHLINSEILLYPGYIPDPGVK